MSSLQPLYDVKERLEAAAIAGTGLLGEDFRLQRAAENMAPLAAASPVFGKISAGLDKLLNAPAEERAGLLLDTLALVDAVVYTQGKSGMDGKIRPSPIGTGAYLPISYGQMQPLLTALTSTGSGRLETIRSAWEEHPEFFYDYRILPAVVAGLGDSYSDVAELNAEILKKTGAAVLPLLKRDFDPAGNREMARRAEVIAAIDSADAVPWLLEILPQAKKDVRPAVIRALGSNPENTALLLELAKTERGKAHDAVLESLALLDGEEIAVFWTEETAQRSSSVIFLMPSNRDWAVDLVTSGLRERLSRYLTGGKRPAQADCEDVGRWIRAIGQKDSSMMLDFWRWADEHMEDIDRIEMDDGKPLFWGVSLTNWMTDIMRRTGPGPLRDFCLNLWERRPEMTRYLFTSFQAALLSCPAAEVYERFSPYILTEEPSENIERAKTLHTVLLRALGELEWDAAQGCHVRAKDQTDFGRPIAQPLDVRWFERLTHAVWKTGGSRASSSLNYWEWVDELDWMLMRLANPAEEEIQKQMIPYLQDRMKTTKQAYTYSHYLFQFGGSPKGLFGTPDIKRNGKSQLRLYALWDLLSAAAQALPAEEAAQIAEEILSSGCVYKDALPRAQAAIPYAAEQLRAGKGFPDWNVWQRIR